MWDQPHSFCTEYPAYELGNFEIKSYVNLFSDSVLEMCILFPTFSFYPYHWKTLLSKLLPCIKSPPKTIIGNWAGIWQYLLSACFISESTTELNFSPVACFSINWSLASGQSQLLLLFKKKKKTKNTDTFVLCLQRHDLNKLHLSLSTTQRATVMFYKYSYFYFRFYNCFCSTFHWLWGGLVPASSHKLKKETSRNSAV